MKKYIISIFICIVFLSASCDHPPHTIIRQIKLENFITQYYMLDTVRATVYQSHKIPLYIELFYGVGENVTENEKNT